MNLYQSRHKEINCVTGVLRRGGSSEQAFNRITAGTDTGEESRQGEGAGGGEVVSRACQYR